MQDRSLGVSENIKRKRLNIFVGWSIAHLDTIYLYPVTV